MFLHIGNAKIIFNSDLIGIFNFLSPKGQVNNKILEASSREALNKYNVNNQPKSFIVTEKSVYISPISPLTLSKRLGATGS